MPGTLETSLSLDIWEQAGQDISKRKEVSTQGRGGKRSLCSALCHTLPPGSIYRILPQEGQHQLSKHAAGLRPQPRRDPRGHLPTCRER